MSRSANNDLMNVHLRALVGKGVENSDISKITKQYLTVPGTVPEMIRQLSNHNALQGDFWGTESIVYLECKKYITGISDYETVYEAAQLSDISFLAKVVYYYDLTVYRLYEECLIKPTFCEIRWELGDLDGAHTKVLNGQFFQTLPPNLMPKKREGETLENSPPNVRQRKERGSSLANMNQPKTLTLNNGEAFNDVILRSQLLKNVPNWPNSKQSVCLNWHIGGSCHDQCERKSTHKNLHDGSLARMESFLKSCRDAAHKRKQEKK
jgi:hypothetical protein